MENAGFMKQKKVFVLKLRYKLLIRIFASLLLISSVSAINDTNLEHCWSFDDVDTIGTALVDSQENQNGTLVNTPTTGIAGIINEAYNFSSGSSEYISLANNLMDAYNNLYTITMWVNVAVVKNGDRPFDAEGRIAMLQMDAGGNMYARIYDGSTTKNTGVIIIGIGDWEHWAITFEAGAIDLLTLYKNGSTIQSVAVTNADNTQNRGVNIGAIYDASGGFIDAAIDNVKIWSRRLNASEILEDYNEGLGLDCNLAVADTTPPTASDWNVTANVAIGENTSIWNTDGTINITLGVLPYTFTADEPVNHSAYVDSETDYPNSDANHRAATTETTDQANTAYDNFTYGKHYLFVSLIDLAGNVKNYTKNFTYWDYPNVTLISPADSSTDSDGIINFTYAPTWLVGNIDNCSLYGNWSGIWELNQTNTTTILNDTANSFNLVNITTNADYSWNVECCNEKGLCNFSEANYTFSIYIDTFPPLWVDLPANWSNDNQTEVLVYFNATDDITIDTYFLNDTTYFNINSTGWLYNITNLTIGNYTILVSVNDTSGNINTTIFTIEIFAYVPPPPPFEFTFKRFECDMSTTAKAVGLIGITMIIIIIWMFALYLKIPILNLFVGFVVVYFGWNIAKCFFLANLLFIIMGLISMMYGILYAFKKQEIIS